MSKPTLIFLIIAGLSVLGFVVLTVVEIRADYRRRRSMAEAGDEDQCIDARLAYLEGEVASLEHKFNASGLADYPGGPLTVGDGHDPADSPQA